jgi:class 3 adenylate cyclase
VHQFAPAPVRAATAAVEVLASVRRTQRVAENEFQVVGALAVGTTSTAPNGAVVLTGGVEVALGRLRERAAPGQILLSDAAREATRNVVETIPARGSTAADGDSQAPTFVLRGLK